VSPDAFAPESDDIVGTYAPPPICAELPVPVPLVAGPFT